MVAAVKSRCTSTATWSSGGGAFVADSSAGSVTTRTPGSCADSTFAASPTASTARGCRSLISTRSAVPAFVAVPWAWVNTARRAVCVVALAAVSLVVLAVVSVAAFAAAPAGAPPAAALVSGPTCAAVSSSGACARSARSRAVARSAGRPGLATTTTGADANSCCATSAATTLAAALVSTDAADAGGRVRAAKRTRVPAEYAVAPAHAVVPPATADSTTSIPARRRSRVWVPSGDGRKARVHRAVVAAFIATGRRHATVGTWRRRHAKRDCATTSVQPDITMIRLRFFLTTQESNRRNGHRPGCSAISPVPCPRCGQDNSAWKAFFPA